MDDAYTRRVGQIRSRVEGYVTSRWGSLGSWRDDDMDAFVAAVVPVVTGGQRQVAALTDAYLSQVLARRLGRRVPPVGPAPGEVTGGGVRNGATPQEVYQRPFHTVWTALAENKPLDAAVALGGQRLTQLASTDLQLAKTHTAREVYARVPEVVGFRRVLTGPSNCALCVLASTQRYRKSDLMPIHPGCGCDVRELLGSDDPGQVIDQATLDRAHQVVAERFGEMDFGGRAPDYRKLITVEEHGEHGPTLTLAGHKFTDLADVQRAADRGLPAYQEAS